MKNALIIAAAIVFAAFVAGCASSGPSTVEARADNEVASAFKGLYVHVEQIKGLKKADEALGQIEEETGFAFPNGHVCPGYQSRSEPVRYCTEQELIDPHLEKIDARVARITVALQYQSADAQLPNQRNATVESFLARVANVVAEVDPPAAAKLDRTRTALAR